MRLLLLALLALTACSSPAEGPPDLILVVAPGLRAGAGALGDGEAALGEALSLRGAKRYTTAYAQTSDPRVSLGSLLTGRYPSAIPLCGDPRAREHEWTPQGGEAPWCAAPPAGTRTLPEVLGIYGYRTALVRGQTVGGDGVDAMFPQTLSGRDRLAAARDWWAEDDGPRFLMVILPQLQLPALAEAFPEAAANQWRGPDGRRAVEPEALRAWYDQQAAAAGREAAAILEILDGARPRWVAVTSTHGVSLSERSAPPSAQRASGMEYLEDPTSRIVLERTIHVPLYIDGPGVSGGVVDAPVELVDLAPTLLALGGAPPVADGSGADLLADPRPPADGVAYAELGDMLAIRDQDRLLTFRAWIHHGTSLDPQLTQRLGHHLRTRDYEPFTLHDPTADPMQARDLKVAERARFQSMSEQLQAIRQGPGALPTELAPEQLKVLQSSQMGYW